MTGPAAPSDAVRAALERLRDGPLGEGSEDYEAGWKDGLDYAIALRIPAAAPVDPKILAAALEETGIYDGLIHTTLESSQEIAAVLAAAYNRLAGQK